MPQPRPEGVDWVITDEWLEWLKRRMREEGVSQRELAERIVARGGQATGSSISDLQTRKTPRSRLVPLINAALGGVEPTQKIVADDDADEVRARIDAKVARLDENGQQLVLQLLERLVPDR